MSRDDASAMLVCTPIATWSFVSTLGTIRLVQRYWTLLSVTDRIMLINEATLTGMLCLVLSAVVVSLWLEP